MPYPKLPKFDHYTHNLALYAQLQHEYGAQGIAAPLAAAEAALKAALEQLKRLPPDPDLARREPSGLTAIQALRPAGPRRLWREFNETTYRERLGGALLGRFAGCTLGAPVEGWSLENMERLAKENGQAFPPDDYWFRVPDPAGQRYGLSRRDAYTRDAMDGVPVDDDLAYTLLGLLIVEDHGPRFTVADVGLAWLKYLPYACTAEDVALRNLKAGIPAEQAGATENPFCEWIGADIRADPWGYLAPGWPERAAALAWRDAYLSHRRNGIYGEMFFAAAIAAGFVVNDPLEAVRLGLTEIPRDCALAKAVQWALEAAPRIRSYRQARQRVDKHFAGMHAVHTINNACLSIFGLGIGGRDLTRVIGETVAMGLDNDCTAATAGSICGSVIGRAGVPAHWHQRFNNQVHSYLIGQPRFTIDDLLNRFTRQAATISAGE